MRRFRRGPTLAVVAVLAISLTAATAGWELGRLDSAALEQQRSVVAQQLAEVDAGVRAATTVGADPSELSPIGQQAADLRRQERSATATELRRIAAGVASLNGQVVSLQRAQLAENAAVEQAALVIGARYAGRLDAMRAAGLAALANGRNDATVAAFLKLGLGRTPGLMDRYAAFIGSADPNQVALGVAGVQRYRPLVSNALVAQLPAQVIVVSIAGQRLQAFDHGRMVQDTLVTTGRAALPTDIGRMQVTRKSAPWTMRSPWPKNSPYWYPDTKVSMVLWFTNTGEGIHDAAWEPASAYGPGSTSGPFASHGCIHTPVDVMSDLFGWAQVGTPVVVIPGDGDAVAAQTAQQSVDSFGRPLGSQPSGV